MALSSQSMFLYGYTIDAYDQYLDFQAASGGPILTATVPIGNYSLTSLLTAVAAAMQSADEANTYAATADRTVMGGTQNRVSILTSGSYLKLLFNSGPSATASIAPILGFNEVDYSGATSYSGSSTTGTTLIPVFYGYNYLDDSNQAKLFGAVNVSAAGVKESVVFNTQYFIDVEFKHEPAANLPNWKSLFTWLISQNPFDFTPEISNPTDYYQVTLEKTDYDGKGLGYRMKEELPSFPNLYGTGPLTFRVVLNYSVQSFTFGG